MWGNVDICDEVKGLLSIKHLESVLFKEVVNIGAVSSQEVKGHRMIVFHRLTHINDPHLSLVVEHVVLTEISMHEAAHVVHASHNE